MSEDKSRKVPPWLTGKAKKKSNNQHKSIGSTSNDAPMFCPEHPDAPIEPEVMSMEFGGKKRWKCIMDAMYKDTVLENVPCGFIVYEGSTADCDCSIQYCEQHGRVFHRYSENTDKHYHSCNTGRDSAGDFIKCTKYRFAKCSDIQIKDKRMHRVAANKLPKKKIKPSAAPSVVHPRGQSSLVISNTRDATYVAGTPSSRATYGFGINRYTADMANQDEQDEEEQTSPKKQRKSESPQRDSHSRRSRSRTRKSKSRSASLSPEGYAAERRALEKKMAKLEKRNPKKIAQSPTSEKSRKVEEDEQSSSSSIQPPTSAGKSRKMEEDEQSSSSSSTQIETFKVGQDNEEKNNVGTEQDTFTNAIPESESVQDVSKDEQQTDEHGVREKVEKKSRHKRSVSSEKHTSRHKRSVSSEKHTSRKEKDKDRTERSSSRDHSRKKKHKSLERESSIHKKSRSPTMDRKSERDENEKKKHESNEREESPNGDTDGNKKHRSRDRAHKKSRSPRVEVENGKKEKKSTERERRKSRERDYRKKSKSSTREKDDDTPRHKSKDKRQKSSSRESTHGRHKKIDKDEQSRSRKHEKHTDNEESSNSSELVEPPKKRKEPSSMKEVLERLQAEATNVPNEDDGTQNGTQDESTMLT